jgi:hypothetical protein
MSRRWPLLLLAVLAGCGGDPLDKHTPGVTPQPVRGAGSGGSAAATPTPTPDGEPVTRAEVRVIRGWSDALRHGQVARAARYFARPAVVSNNSPPVQLSSTSQVRAFNSGLTCGARLERTQRAPHHFVYGVFRLTDRPGGACGTGTGGSATVAFLVRHDHIRQWLRVPDLPSATADANQS